jgi:uncharacterized protein YecT (DUF1311 family)
MRKIGLYIVLVLLARPAFAIDCTAATNTVEKAICSDPEAVRADEALGKACIQLRKSLPDRDAAGLRHAQLEWIHTRDTACAAANAVKPLSSCLAEQSRERQRFLDGRPRAGDSSLSLFRPVFIFRPATNGSAPLSIEAIKFAGTGEWQSRLNATIDAAVKRAMSDAEAAKDNPGGHDNYSVDLEIDLAYATSRMVSVQVDSGSYLGQAHPDSESYNINFDTARGRELTFNDLLDEARAKPVFEFCRSQVAKQKRERSDDPDHWNDDVESAEAAEGTRNFSSWRFSASSVDVYYGAYGFGGYGQCMCTCTIPYSMLRPIAKQEFPLP